MFFTNVQIAVTRYLASCDFFTGTDGLPSIPVIAGNDKGVLGKSKSAMGRLGLCVLVVPLGGDFAEGGGQSAFLNPGRFVCRVRENQIVNRGPGGCGDPGDYVAEVVAYLIKNYVPSTEDGTALGGGGIVLEGMSPGEDEPGITAWDVIWTFEGGISHTPLRGAYNATDLP